MTPVKRAGDAHPKVLAGARRLGLSVVMAVTLSATLSATADARSRSYTIQTSKGFITSIGSLRMSGADGGTLARAIVVFGRPSQIRPIADGSDGCTIRWKRLGLNATFANFGIESACAPRGGRFQAATIRSTRFRTSRGVRVGSRSSTIRDKHRLARFVSGSWWIASATSPFGDEREIATVRALVRAGRVWALKLWVGAAGD